MQNTVISQLKVSYFAVRKRLKCEETPCFSFIPQKQTSWRCAFYISQQSDYTSSEGGRKSYYINPPEPCLSVCLSLTCNNPLLSVPVGNGDDGT